jgi:hypothetical protein
LSSTQLTHFITIHLSVLCTSGGNIHELLGENFERHGGTVFFLLENARQRHVGGRFVASVGG